MDLSSLNTQLITHQQFVTLTGSQVFTQLSVIATVDPGDLGNIRYLTAAANHRTEDCIRYINRLFAECGADYFNDRPHEPFSFVMEGGDRPNDTPCVSWQRKWFYKDVVLLPDYYYADHNGYRDFMAGDVPSWESRAQVAFWRGSTTGGYGFTKDELYDLPRYRMCRIGQSLGNLADFKFYHVVQTKSEQDENEVRDFLKSSDLMSWKVAMEDYAKYKFIIQIDGNGNSWELVKKLRLGSCMLLVDSDWLLWHNPMLRPWTHYVPVKNDLSDLAEIIQWCNANDAAAAQIAANGREFALSIDYAEEMKESVRLIVAHADARKR